MEAYRKHLKSANDLKTPYEMTRAGFVSIALERNEKAAPHIAEAKDLKIKAQAAKSAMGLRQVPDINKGLLTAAGISDKAAGHIDAQGHLDAINGLIKNYLEPAGPAFVEELVYRFLLTRGDTLGGSMRNLVGALAQRKFTRALIASLNVAGVPFYWLSGTTKSVWVSFLEEASLQAERAKGISWVKNGKKRTLVYNLKVPFLGKNVDMCLFGCGYDEMITLTSDDAAQYLALGELKGGFDPAGADEHWKTANSALIRIRTKFSEQNKVPHLFFIATVIEDSMAREIWEQLENGSLKNAANLTQDKHMSSFCAWLINL